MIKLEKEQTARFAARLEQETQESVMRDIAQFSEADIVDTWASEPPACAEVHAMEFNMERGVHIDEAIEFLKDNPSLQPIDLIPLPEYSGDSVIQPRSDSQNNMNDTDSVG